MPQVGNLVYGTGADAIFVNLYVGSVATIPWKNGAVRLTQNPGAGPGLQSSELPERVADAV